MDAFKSLLMFEWLKGYRTFIIVLFVVAGYAIENLAGIDIPGVQFTLDDVLLAVGLKTAADHDNG